MCCNINQIVHALLIFHIVLNILDDVHHPVEVVEESAVNEAAEKLLSFDLPAEPEPVHEHEPTPIG